MINQTTANISWIYPLDTNNPDDISLLGGMIKGFYVIVFAPLSMQPPIVHRNYEGTIGTQYWDIVGNLTPGTTYHAQVKAFTKKGDGKPSVPYIFTVPKEDFRECYVFRGQTSEREKITRDDFPFLLALDLALVLVRCRISIVFGNLVDVDTYNPRDYLACIWMKSDWS